jgi:hypothetical protein
MVLHISEIHTKYFEPAYDWQSMKLQFVADITGWMKITSWLILQNNKFDKLEQAAREYWDIIQDNRMCKMDYVTRIFFLLSSKHCISIH